MHKVAAIFAIVFTLFAINFLRSKSVSKKIHAMLYLIVAGVNEFWLLQQFFGVTAALLISTLINILVASVTLIWSLPDILA
jgi:hypothetical protein